MPDFEQGHLGGELGGLAGQPELRDFPPPDLGFMITKGRCGGTTAYSRGLGRRPAARSAARLAATAAAASTTLSATSHSSPATAYTTITTTGAAASPSLVPLRHLVAPAARGQHPVRMNWARRKDEPAIDSRLAGAAISFGSVSSRLAAQALRPPSALAD